MSAASILIIEQAFITLGGREILHSAGLRLVQGRITGLLGNNGCGKSTLLQMLFGNLKGGQEKIVSINNKRLKRPAYTSPGLVNYLPQRTMLPSAISMRRLCVLFHVSIEELLTYFPDLAEELAATVDELSGGKQRLWQILLLSLAPTTFTILDEPFTHLSPVYVEQLKPMLRVLCMRKGFLLTDHMYGRSFAGACR